MAVNKMDLVDWEQRRFAEGAAQMGDLAQKHGEADVHAVPILAIHGGTLVHRSHWGGWYRGPTVPEVLEQVPTSPFAVQGSTGRNSPSRP